MKITTELEQFLEEKKTAHIPLTLVTGFFDVLHQEHRRFLEKAKQLGGALVVGLESDARARQVKGEGRPIFPQEQRQKNLEEWGIADSIFILPDSFSSPQDHDDLIRIIHPRYLAVSSHTKHLDKKQAILSKYGGEVKIVHEHNPNISTTLLLEKQQS
jgi:cytidyltransferase-like protein